MADDCLTGETILATDDIDCRRVDVPEWGGYVYVQTMSAASRDHLEQLAADDNLTNIRALVGVMTMCDADRQPLFTMDQVTALAAKSASALDRVFVVAQELNAITDKDVEDMAKN